MGSKKTRGFWWHIHHEILCEYTSGIAERIRYIKSDKDPNEVPLRLKLMVPVKNPERLPRELVEADQKWGEAGQKVEEAYQKWEEANQKHREVYRMKWEEAYQKMKEAYRKHLDAYWKHLPKIEALHKEEHPDCPWNGSTIFPK